MAESPSIGGRAFFYCVWPDGCAVFDRLSGDTHLLDVFSALLFLEAAKAPPERMTRLRFPDWPSERINAAKADARERLGRLHLPSPQP